MVSFRIVSEYTLDSPLLSGGQKIAGGPVYSLTRVQGLCADGTGVSLWTRDCYQNVQSLQWTADDVADLIQQLKDADYIDSEWCDNGKGAIAGCDAYALRRMEWISAANKQMQIEYFVKFAINKLGTLVLTVSCHT